MISRGSTVEKLQMAFRFFDTDKNKFIDRNELQTIIREFSFECDDYFNAFELTKLIFQKFGKIFKIHCVRVLYILF